MNKCAFPETYLLKYQPLSFIVIAIVLLKVSNNCLFHYWFWANFNSLSVLKLFRKWWRHQNVRRKMGFSYFMLEVLLRITEMFIHVKTSENWFFIKGISCKSQSSYRSAHCCLFQTINCCNSLAFPKSQWDFPVGMISHECWLAE